MVLLQGRLEVIVIEARGLPNLDHNVFNSNDKSDPYCIVTAEGINGSWRIGKTFTIDDCLNPKWHFKMVSEFNQDVTKLKFTVKDKDPFGSETIGSCELETAHFTQSAKYYKGLMHLISKKGKAAGTLRVQVSFTGSGTSSTEKKSMIQKIQVAKEDVKNKFIYNFTDISSKSLEESYNYSSSIVFLHGVLEIFLNKATDLPNYDTSLFNKKDVTDPYVIIYLEDASGDRWRVGTSSVVENNLNPIWRETFRINMCHEVVSIRFVVKDKDFLTADEIGSFSIQAQDIKPPKEIGGDFNLNIKLAQKKTSKLNLGIKFIPAKDIIVSPEVPECIFPMREMNKVTLYQDAHCVKLPVQIQGYTPRRAWLDLYHTIIGAKEFIYIVGWSVNYKISLLRWTNEDTRSIGDILIEKADAGIHVCIMIWDELTSTELNKDGVMGTSDEATQKFFKNTAVTVILASREKKSKKRISAKENFTNFCYSHHQKCIIADACSEDMPDRSKVVAYVGGLDLTDGRFDTPDHPLFSTLQSDHKNDFYNSVFLTQVQYGPREPWHDIHCRIEGPCTMDLFANFEERWKKQGSKKKKDKSLIKTENAHKNNLRTPDRWNVQIFRSINSDSASFHVPGKIPGLFIKKDGLFDNSIHRAYLHQIRRSKKFLYIENQYFMGSSHAWLDCKDAKIKNLIPLEIATHIEEKIREKKPFTAYILIPMFPEGKPASKAIQEILHWQFRTMEMMYRRIADALSAQKINAHPQDYLLFFCLGKKEGRNTQSTPQELMGHAANAFTHRRMMIYVHSKMAIFDDEYIIIGSANINDRSMSGNRDTEIAIGAFQPEHMVHGSTLPGGDVATFRKSLWAEHMGQKAPIDIDPSSKMCIQKLKQLAEENLLSYIDNADKPSKGHLLIYPLDIARNGDVSTRSDCPTFPDTVAKVIGERSGYIPTKITS